MLPGESNSGDTYGCTRHYAFKSGAQSAVYWDAIDTMILLRRQPGSEAPKTDRQWTIDYSRGHVILETWGGEHNLRSQVSRISPSFGSQAHAKAAIDTIGEDRLIRMFETLHGLKGAA